MKLSFHIEYHTAWGEQVGVLIEGVESPVMLSSVDGAYWAGSAEVSGTPATYRYGIFRDGEAVRVESGRMCSPQKKTFGEKHWLSAKLNRG